MRNYLLHFSVAALLVLLPTIFFAWWAEPLSKEPNQADLTRIGKWTAHDFGPNAMHPTVHVNASGQSTINPDVMVLGDSFSGLNLWQSVLSHNTGYVVNSFHYDKNCIPNFIGAAIADPASKFIVVETVERSFVERFSHISSCPRTELIPLEAQAGIKAYPRPTWPPTLSLSYLTATAINTAELNIFPEMYFNKFTVVNTPLRTGCVRFSNRRNDRLLYYADDDFKQLWSAQEIRDAVANVLRIQKEVERRGKKFVLVVAPDKSSVYQACLLHKNDTQSMPNITEILISFGVKTPNLLTSFRGNINKIVDLYDPDNTHWSEAGYILAGNEIGKYLSSMDHQSRVNKSAMAGSNIDAHLAN